MGDCFAYACARSNRAKLLFKGLRISRRRCASSSAAILYGSVFHAIASSTGSATCMSSAVLVLQNKKR